MTTSVRQRVLKAHRLLGTIAAFYAFLHLVFTVITRHGIKPFSAFGWLNEQVSISFLLLITGVAMALPVGTKTRFVKTYLEGDTARHEKILREIVHESVPILNKFAEEQALEVQITDKEVVITFLAEGGALLLTEAQSDLDRVHPVRHTGLDDFRLGFAKYPKLVKRLDAHFGTQLGSLSITVVGRALLLRPMTFRGAVLGTAIMYLYEKELTNVRRNKEKRIELSKLPLSEQFVHSSLVYNSGTLFSDERVQQILTFDTGEYLYSVGIANAEKRRLLSVMEPKIAKRQLENGGSIPTQLASWNAVYHILQRYGAWVGISKFSEIFDAEGNFILK